MLFKIGTVCKAIAADDLVQVKDLLARYPHVSTKTRAYECMDVALAKASDEMVFLLSDSGWNLLAANTQSRTALQQAVYCGRQSVVREWLARYPLLWTEEDRTKLMLVAVEKKDTAMLKFLIDSGISNPALPLPYYENPLHKAMTERYQDGVQILREGSAARRGKQEDAARDMPAPGADPVAPARWHMVDDTTIILVREQRTAGYRLTDVFNFALGTCISIQRNLETNAETAVTLDLSAVSGTATVQAAHAELIRAGGNPPSLPKAPSPLRKGSAPHV